MNGCMHIAIVLASAQVAAIVYLLRYVQRGILVRFAAAEKWYIAGWRNPGLKRIT